MARQRGPHHSKKCPFHIAPNQPLSAEKSVARCVKCVTCNNQRLQSMKADLHQIAHLTIAENSPKYDPEHESGASFSTFIRSRVCATLWNESEKLLQWIPLPTVEWEFSHKLQEHGATNFDLPDDSIDGSFTLDGLDDGSGDDLRQYYSSLRNTPYDHLGKGRYFLEAYTRLDIKDDKKRKIASSKITKRLNLN